MYKGNEILRVQQLTDILSVIDAAETKIRILTDGLKHWDGLPTITMHTKNRIDTLERVILRLEKCYNKILNK